MGDEAHDRHFLMPDHIINKLVMQTSRLHQDFLKITFLELVTYDLGENLTKPLHCRVDDISNVSL